MCLHLTVSRVSLIRNELKTARVFGGWGRVGGIPNVTCRILKIMSHAPQLSMCHVASKSKMLLYMLYVESKKTPNVMSLIFVYLSVDIQHFKK